MMLPEVIRHWDAYETLNPGNLHNQIIPDYEPPRKAHKLCTKGGKPLLPAAEKTSKLCHQFLLIYAKKGDLVLDMHAGSGSMAVACMQHGCRYMGTEIAEKVHKATQLKLARLGAVREAGFMSHWHGLGVPSGIDTQVAFYFVFVWSPDAYVIFWNHKQHNNN